MDVADRDMKWRDWKELWRMTEDDDEEPSMTIAAKPDEGQAGGKEEVC